jgi:hypothetical protein
MNNRDALAVTAKEGAGIVRVPSWQAQAGLAAGHLARLFAGYEPAPVPLHLMFQPSRRASPKIRALVDDLVEHSRGVDPFGGPPRVDRNGIIVQFLNRAKWPWYTKPLINRAS